MDPAGCLRIIQNWGDMVCLKGNAELYLLTPDWDEFPQKEQGMYKELFSILGWWKAKIPAATLEWVESWPNIVSVNGACLVHDSPMDRLAPEEHSVDGIDKKYHELMHHAPGLSTGLSEADQSKLEKIMHQNSFCQVFAGHTHIPFVRHINGLTICNVGSVGFNLDGNPEAAWVSVDGELGENCRIAIHRVAYDIERTIAIVKASSDYPSFALQDRQNAYEEMIRTAKHWRVHMPR